MRHNLLYLAALAHLLWLPSQLSAGGPPWLCLPIDGVTADNQSACTALISAKLEHKLWPKSESFRSAEIHRDGDQSYLTFYMKEDIGLAEIEAAFQGSEFAIPRDRIRLFGHAVLDIDAQKASAKELVAALDALPNVAIDEVDENKGLLRATVQMPYPVVDNRPNPENLSWEKFAWNDYTSVAPKKSDSPVGRQELPDYQAFRDVLATHHASLKDIHWSTAHACRALGCVSAPKADKAIGAAKLTSNASN
jgi:hypothetical protein